MLIIPGTGFNKSRTRLFWFFSYDYLHNTGVTGANRYTMPTALERQGDFSQTLSLRKSPGIRPILPPHPSPPRIVKALTKS